MKLKEIHNIPDTLHQSYDRIKITSWNNIRYDCYKTFHSDNKYVEKFQENLMTKYRFFSIFDQQIIWELLNESNKTG